MTTLTGATLDQVADVLDRPTATVVLRLRRAARGTPAPALPAGVLTISQITRARNWSVTTVHILRDTGRLPMHRQNGWWVARQNDVDALSARPRTQRRGPGILLDNASVTRPDSSRRLVTPAEVAALRAAAARIHRDVPACHRHAPPPWPVYLLCEQPTRHDGEHSSRHRGGTARWT